MYGDNSASVGCMSASATLKGCMSVSVSRIGEDLAMMVSRIGEDIAMKTSRIGEDMVITCSIVCNVSTTDFVRVKPQYIWLMPSNDFTDEVDVISNVVWHVN